MAEIANDQQFSSLVLSLHPARHVVRLTALARVHRGLLVLLYSQRVPAKVTIYLLVEALSTVETRVVSLPSDQKNGDTVRVLILCGQSRRIGHCGGEGVECGFSEVVGACEGAYGVRMFVCASDV